MANDGGTAVPDRRASRWLLAAVVVSDSYVADDASTAQLAALDQGRFFHYGQELRVTWLDPDESARVRVATFDS